VRGRMKKKNNGSRRRRTGISGYSDAPEGPFSSAAKQPGPGRRPRDQRAGLRNAEAPGPSLVAAVPFFNHARPTSASNDECIGRVTYPLYTIFTSK